MSGELINRSSVVGLHGNVYFEDGERGDFMDTGIWWLSLGRSWCRIAYCPPLPCGMNWVWGLRKQEMKKKLHNLFSCNLILDTERQLKLMFSDNIKWHQVREKGFALCSTHVIQYWLSWHVWFHGDFQWLEQSQRPECSMVNEDSWPPPSTQQLLTLVIAVSTIIRYTISDIPWRLPEKPGYTFMSLKYYMSRGRKQQMENAII